MIQSTDEPEFAVIVMRSCRRDGSKALIDGSPS